MQSSDSAQTKHYETPETDAKLRLSAHQTLWNTRDRCKDQTQCTPSTPSTVKHQRQKQSSDSAHTKHTKNSETPETDAKIRLRAHQTQQALWNTRDRCKDQTQHTASTVKHQRQMQRSDSVHIKHCETPETDAKIRLSAHQALQALWNTRDRSKAQTQRTPSTLKTLKHQRQMQRSDSGHTKHNKHCETPETDAKIRLSTQQALWNTRDRCKDQTQRTPNTPSTVKHQRQMQSSDSAHTKHC